MTVKISRRKNIVVYNLPRDESAQDQANLGTKLCSYAVTNFYDSDRLIKDLLGKIFSGPCNLSQHRDHDFS